MSPQFFVALYNYLQIGTPTGPKTVNVWRYYIKSGEAEHERRKTELGKIKDAAAKKGRQYPRTLYQRVWSGKGSPSDIRAVLENGVLTGVLKDDTKVIQEFVDQNIGVDCGGFVSSFFRESNLMGADESIWDSVGSCRTEVGQIWRCDLLRWYTKDLVLLPKPGHVAIVDTPPYSGGVCQGNMVVCESCGHKIGISKNTYHILDIKKNSKGEYIFKVDRDLVSFNGKRVTEKDDYVKIMPHV
jgi:hypothetical protein